MDEIVGMTVPPPLPGKNQTRDLKQAAAAVSQQTVSIQTVSFPSPLSAVEATGATVLIGGSAPVADSTATCIKDCVPEVQSDSVRDWQKTIECPQQHVVKIRINPKNENSKVISSVRLNLDKTLIDSKIRNKYEECSDKQNGVVLVCTASRAETENDGCVRINIINSKNHSNDDGNLSHLQQYDKNEMIQQNSSLRNSFYYGSFQSPLANMVMSSGQCSPSDTLDSGTCSDLDGTPPPLPKKSSCTILLSESTNTEHNNHHRTGSLSSSGADADSDENDNDDDSRSNISCDSLNSGELSSTQVNGIANVEEKGFETQQHATNFDAENNSNDVKVGEVDEVNKRTKAHRMSTKLDILLVNEMYDSNLKKDEYDEKDISNYLTSNCNMLSSSSATLKQVTCIPRVSNRSPTENTPQQSWIPIVRECTYEERNQIQERTEANYYSNYNNSISNTKYVYDDDRFYKFHLHERCFDDKGILESMVIGKGENDDKENECFAGYKISEKEAIRSAKGTVRGVKNRVRAGIATFLQKPSTKNYKVKDEGKVVVYSTTMGIVRETYYACMKVKQILRTHLVKYEERDMFMSTECQTELRDRIESSTIEVPQLFIDGEYIGNADTVERLNESGELRLMLKPYKSADACSTCKICGGYRLLPCPICNGSKKSVHRNDFTTEFVALKCMNCDEAGLVRCQHC
ncbi:uncharacterized protein LOC127288795 [Leptopilina boulardi]|uniref:uncharacterized protein LOC127288795 n=1 Tax=Leptopilina boulardi TaxID=63433 RepID=UPI0021F56E71|nr:uncharacterized protein LOC127288795 [Leptopilina boulardi]XP_051172408.1 uncharacterized protein LOC127288795 [Leptopilina boulardi]XP_051172409.1 uncharacterized protein LOC127288795 [Leptopilina boulardi]XP_051172410.1 uncharacterized protein LOC127288795 [Leptopilina boulardi]